jgi:ABC-type Zn uptake system ZnuABC Zn-binding protein ZnuA
MNPRNQIVMAQTIADRLSEMAPDHAEQFEASQAAFAEQMSAAIAGWEERMAPWRGREIVCYHKQWEYLVNWLGLTVMDYIENKPGIPPSPRHVRELNESMLRRGITVVVISNFFEPGPARRVAETAGSQLVILPASVDGEDGLGDPFLFFEHVVDSIDNAFKAGVNGG